MILAMLELMQKTDVRSSEGMNEQRSSVRFPGAFHSLQGFLQLPLQLLILCSKPFSGA